MTGAAAAQEGGIDVPLKAGTPVYALGNGTLQGYGNFWHPNGNPGYGVLTQRVTIPGLGDADVYYQHMDLAGPFTQCQNGNCSNQYVQAGQLIGYSRADPGEVEVGINPPWFGVWGGKHPSQPVNDPRPYLSALAGGAPSNPTTTSTTSAACAPWDVPCLVNNLRGTAVRIGVFIVGLLFFIIGAVILLHPDPGKLAGDIAKGAMLA